MDTFTAAFLFDADSQSWAGFFPGQPALLTGFTVVERLDTLFILNPTVETFDVELPEVSGEITLAEISAN